MVCCGICYTAPPRQLLTILAFIGLTLAFCMRQVLPISISEITINSEEPHKWTELQQALILMGFYIGYSISHIGAGLIIQKMGARIPIIIGMIISSVMTGLIPFVSSFHWSALVVIRIITGAGQSVLMPGISSLLTYWVPLENRSTIAAIIYAGAPMGTFLGIYLSAIVSSYWKNWQYAYYMWSGFTATWLVLFMVYIYSYPKTHPRISAQGSSYQRADFIQNELVAEKVQKLSYGCQIVATFGHTYILFTLDTYLPKYLHEVLKYEVEDYSIYAGTPFALMYMCGIISRLGFSWMVNKKNINVDFLRVIYCSFGNVLSGVTLVSAFYIASQQQVTTLVLIHIAALLAGFFYGGLNMLDMSIRNINAMSLVNGLATTSGVAAITVIALIAKNRSSTEWTHVSYILLAVEVLVWILDCMFTATKLCLQPRDEDRRWHQNIPQAQHKDIIKESAAVQEELKKKQRGEQSAETESSTSRP
ncbi:sialin-like [Atheta coriaria]|uniref:sialin-like n=1 Tax=Dalotia coriaria TaxID=877792 RepID=UPI0031F46B30